MFFKFSFAFIRLTKMQVIININILWIVENEYKIYPVYYPVGNGMMNMEKAIEDIKFIIEKY